MTRIFASLAAAALLLWPFAAAGQELVHFASLDDNGAGQPPTMLDGYLFCPAGGGAHPAIVGVPDCSGMMIRTSGGITSNYWQWAAELASLGYVVMLVDSLGPRHHGEMCSVGGFRRSGCHRHKPGSVSVPYS